ncbi:MAG: calcium/sodium antiporter [Burkholderiales bacterium]|nr:MAG: calcium/sodium antiporter [Burkholderiales bacterium]
MIANVIHFALGLLALIVGARWLVRGAATMALSLGISPLVIGLTIVSMGTSAPEVAVSVGAALEGRTDMAVGNVIGSNVFNVLFILGLSALVSPLVVNAQLIRQEVPIMIAASLLLAVLAADRHIGRPESVLLLALLAAYTVFLIVQSRRETQATRDEYAEAMPPQRAWDRHWAAQLALVLGGLALLVLGSNWLVEAAVAFARALGVSELVIALTIVSAGTSMPEVATSLMAALKGERDIAVGNIVGSNIFNILGCVGAAGLAAGGGLPVPAAALAFDLWVMLAVTFACLPVFLSGREIARWEGGLFLGYYFAYTAFLMLAARQHQALPAFSAAMLSFVVPLTIVTLLVSMLRTQRGGH